MEALCIQITTEGSLSIHLKEAWLRLLGKSFPPSSMASDIPTTDQAGVFHSFSPLWVPLSEGLSPRSLSWVCLSLRRYGDPLTALIFRMLVTTSTARVMCQLHIQTPGIPHATPFFLSAGD